MSATKLCPIVLIFPPLHLIKKAFPISVFLIFSLNCLRFKYVDVKSLFAQHRKVAYKINCCRLKGKVPCPVITYPDLSETTLEK